MKKGTVVCLMLEGKAIPTRMLGIPQGSLNRDQLTQRQSGAGSSQVDSNVAEMMRLANQLADPSRQRQNRESQLRYRANLTEEQKAADKGQSLDNTFCSDSFLSYQIKYD